jgi:hypothetical protein
MLNRITGSTTPVSSISTPIETRALRFLHHLFALLPIVSLATLYLFSWRVASVIGYWPRPSLDDPKFVVASDLPATVFYDLVMVLILGSGMAIIMFPLLSLMLFHRQSRLRLVVLALIFIAGWVLLRSDPGDRVLWYMD